MKNTVNLKNIYTEQLTKLQQKHKHECELLEDLRLFAKQRSIIEKEYAQSLSKLAQQYLTKRPPLPPPSLASQEGNKEQKTMHEVWQTLLEETDKVGKTRLMAADVYSQQISDSCKLVRSVKVQVAKKVFENLVEIQKDLTGSIQELTKLQKVYREEEHVAHDVRVKAAEAEDKVKKKSVGLFTSMVKLQQQSSMLNSRMDLHDLKATVARNEYLLCLAAVNAHLNRYYTKDAPELIKAMDGEIYEKMQEYFTAFCHAELQSCGITQECFMRILADSTKVNRDFQLRGFLQDNSIFTDLIQYQFQPQDNDQITKVSTDDGNLSRMEAETKKCASRFVQEDRAIRQATKKLQKLIDQVSPSNKGQDQPQESSSASIADPQVKIEEMKQVIRKSGIEKTKVEARLESLRKAGINVDVYIAAARSETRTPEDEEEPGLTTQAAITTPPIINSAGDAGSSFTNINVNQKSDDVPPQTMNEFPGAKDANANNYKVDDVPTTWIDDAPTTWVDSQQPQQQQQPHQQQISSGSPSYQSFTEQTHQVEPEIGQPSVALYSFQASASNEIDINEGEQLQALGEAGDGWIRARNSAGRSGLVPASYVQIGSVVLPADRDVHSPTHSYDSNKATAATSQNQQQYNGDYRATSVQDYPVEDAEVLVENGVQAAYSTSDYEVQAALTTLPIMPSSEGIWARAMYDYYATCDEELTFPEGQLIKILRKELHDGVDDGWWEGEFNGKVGVFPSLVVEELVDNEDKTLESPQRPGPPEFSPPPPETTTSLPQSPPMDLPPAPQQLDDQQSPPTPPPPFEPNPQLEITIPTPEGGKATSELLQDYEDRTRMEEEEGEEKELLEDEKKEEKEESSKEAEKEKPNEASNEALPMENNLVEKEDASTAEAHSDSEMSDLC